MTLHMIVLLRALLLGCDGFFGFLLLITVGQAMSFRSFGGEIQSQTGRPPLMPKVPTPRSGGNSFGARDDLSLSIGKTV